MSDNVYKEFIYLEEIQKHKTPTLEACRAYVEKRGWGKSLKERDLWEVYIARVARRGRKAQFVWLPKFDHYADYHRVIARFIQELAKIQGHSPSKMCAIINGEKGKATSITTTK